MCEYFVTGEIGLVISQKNHIRYQFHWQNEEFRCLQYPNKSLGEYQEKAKNESIFQTK